MTKMRERKVNFYLQRLDESAFKGVLVGEVDRGGSSQPEKEVGDVGGHVTQGQVGDDSLLADAQFESPDERVGRERQVVVT